MTSLMNIDKHRKWSKNKWAHKEASHGRRGQKGNIGLVKARKRLAVLLLGEKRQKSAQHIRGLNR